MLNNQLTHTLRLTVQKLKGNTIIIDTNDVGNIRRKIIFKYEKNLPLLLEFHLDKQKAEELKKQIEVDTPLTIEIEIDNAKYKYILNEVHSCEISEDALKIKFYGEIYKDDNQLADEHLKCFTCTIVKGAKQVEDETHGNQYPQKKTHTSQSRLNDFACVSLVCMTVGFSSLGWLLCTKKHPINPFIDDSVINGPIMGGIFILFAVLSAAMLVGSVAMATCAKKEENPGMDTCTAGTVFRKTSVSNYQEMPKHPNL